MADRVKLTTTQTGTGDIDLSLTTPEDGFEEPRFSGAWSTNYRFVIEEGADFEISEGTLHMGSQVDELYETWNKSNGNVTPADGLRFKPDGTRFWLVRTSKVWQFDCSTPWDVSTASFDTSTSVSSSRDSDIAWNSDGTKFWVVGSAAHEYSVTTAYDVSTKGSYTYQGFGGDGVYYDSVTFNSDGTRWYGMNNGLVFSYALSTAYDLTSKSQAAPDEVTHLPETPFGVITSQMTVQVNSDETELYSWNSSLQSFVVYRFGTAGDVTTLKYSHTLYKNKNISDDQDTDFNVYSANVAYLKDDDTFFLHGYAKDDNSVTTYVIQKRSTIGGTLERNLIRSSTGSKLSLTSDSVIFITKTSDEFLDTYRNFGFDSIGVGRYTSENATSKYSSHFGAYAGRYDEGQHNTLLGYGAGDASTGGNYNTAVGSSAMGTDETSDNVTAVGYSAGLGRDVSYSTYVGSLAGNYNTSAGKTYNVGIGYNCMNDHYAGSNVAVGANAMSDGNHNSSVAIGYDALGRSSTSSAYYNVAIGANAGNNIYTGDYNILIGYNPDVGSTSHSNVIVIGKNATSSASNQITLGDTAITSLRCAVTTITALSDERDKTAIQDITYGLDFINDLRPVEFTWNRRDGTWGTKKDIGFIAQDLLDVEIDHSSASRTRLVNDSDPTHLHADYFRTYPILVKAVQELSEKCDALEARIAALEGA